MSSYTLVRYAAQAVDPSQIPIHKFLLQYYPDPRSATIPGTNLQIPYPLLFVLAVIGLWFVLLWISSRFLSSMPPKKTDSEDLVKRRNVKFASWACLFLTVSFIWIYTVFSGNRSDLSIALRLIGAIFVVPLILILEALGLSLLELADKELPASLHGSDLHQTKEILRDFQMNMEGYLRAREWCLAALIIFLTVLVEFDEYHVPFLGIFEGLLPRVAITAILATVAVIWIAQAPGKELGRTSPVGFLNLWKVPDLFHRVVLRLVRWANISRIDEPSDITARFLRDLFNLKEDEPLPPVGTRFFAELVRRYGYADCEVNETYTISHDGSCTIEQTEMAYIAKGTGTYTRLLVGDVAFATLPKVLQCDAFIVPELSIRMEHDLQEWSAGRNLNRQIAGFQVEHETSWQDATQKTAMITVSLPDKSLANNEGFLLKIKTSAHLPAGAFKGPGIQGPDSWTRTLSKPCYKASTTLKLNPGITPAFFKEVEYVVLQDDHGKVKQSTRETARFNALQKEADGKRNTTDGVSADGTALTIELLYGLPGVKYKASWNMRQ